MDMQAVSRLAPVRAGAPCQQQAARATTPSRGCAWLPCGRVAPAPRLRLRASASCEGGATEPVGVEARKGVAPAVDQELAAEELEVLEEAAIAGVDEGRRPTDYDRRAHIFEESSRVFRELKHRQDGDGGVAGDATAAAETATRHHQQQQLG